MINHVSVSNLPAISLYFIKSRDYTENVVYPLECIWKGKQKPTPVHVSNINSRTVSTVSTFQIQWCITFQQPNGQMKRTFGGLLEVRLWTPWKYSPERKDKRERFPTFSSFVSREQFPVESTSGLWSSFCNSKENYNENEDLTDYPDLVLAWQIILFSMAMLRQVRIYHYDHHIIAQRHKEKELFCLWLR